MGKFIYLDNAATTKTAPEVVEAMLPYFTENYGNPSSVYTFASGNKEAISEQRDVIAEVLGAKSNEIYFTAGDQNPTTGRLRRLRKLTEIRGITLSRRRSSTMRSSIRQNIWRRGAMRSLIWMWTRTGRCGLMI